jgi:ribonuclease HI
MAKHRAIAYTDGAFSSTTRQIGSGVVIHANNVIIDGVPLPWLDCEISIKLDVPNVKCFKNNELDTVATNERIELLSRHGSLIGELQAARLAGLFSYGLGVRSLNLNYDFSGVELFSQPENVRARHKSIPFLNNYALTCDELRKHMFLRFTKVDAHSGNELNDRADKLAQGKLPTL